MIVVGVDLRAVNPTDQVTITLAFEKTFVSIPSVAHFMLLERSIAITGTIVASDPQKDPAQQNRSFISVDFSKGNTQLTLTPASHQQIVTGLGDKCAKQFEDTLLAQISSSVLGQGQTASGFFFTVEPGADSTSPQTLTAKPDILWITEDTLGIFGYLRANPTGGDPTSKPFGDRDPTDLLSAAILLSPAVSTRLWHVGP